MARASPLGEKRIVLIDMAQTWLRLAEEEEASVPPVERLERVVQPQQQVQPKDADKED
jgi:hypothetical protein